MDTVLFIFSLVATFLLIPPAIVLFMSYTDWIVNKMEARKMPSLKSKSSKKD